MKDSRNADVEIALGVGVTTATLLESGTIASGGFVASQIAELGATTGLTVFADMGMGAVSLCGAIGPVGLAIAGIGGIALIAHGIYRGI
ncbi:hypothetical protein C823_007692 [Eubacterium plexicaudatum ASF492]|uniref:Uncharacterized protein n=1 Tax=Eubacterium plexicaudatum ASF492 TaxID=1235802 RepID=N1ZW49_9FIRM|nr:hypothetical protein C823_007692 [Eubacterium plexicaudatum ASF492]